jgi:hypothetical protein
MTVEEFQRALHISDEQIRDLKSLREALVKFDKELAHDSPGAHKLAVAAADVQLRLCEQFIANLLAVTLKEAQELTGAMLGGSSGAHMMTTNTMALSFLIGKPIA